MTKPPLRCRLFGHRFIDEWWTPPARNIFTVFAVCRRCGARDPNESSVIASAMRNGWTTCYAATGETVSVDCSGYVMTSDAVTFTGEETLP